MQFNQGAADRANAGSPYGGRPDEIDDDILKVNIGADGRMDGVCLPDKCRLAGAYWIPAGAGMTPEAAD